MTGSVVSAQGSVTFADGETIDFTSAGKYLSRYSEGKWVRDIRPVPSPGENGQGTQSFGTRSFTFTVEVIYVAADETTLVANINTDLLICSYVSEVSIASTAFFGCSLDDSKEVTRARRTGYGLCWKTIAFTFISYRPTDTA